jgi:hypothetical protein
MARKHQVQAAESQGESLADIHGGVLLSAGVQLDPTASKRARLQALLTLMAQRPQAEEEDGWA